MSKPQDFKKGDKRINRKGRPIGSVKEKSFTEYFDEICEEIALANKMPVEDVKKVIYKVGYAKAKEGNYQFYKDMLDRIHGQATSKTELKADVNFAEGLSLEEQIKLRELLNDNNARPKQDDVGGEEGKDIPGK